MLLSTFSWLISIGLAANGGGVLDSQPCYVLAIDWEGKWTI